MSESFKAKLAKELEKAFTEAEEKNPGFMRALLDQMSEGVIIEGSTEGNTNGSA